MYFVLNYIALYTVLPCKRMYTLLSALYTLAHLVLTLSTERPFKVVIVTIPISSNEEQASSFDKVIMQF